MKKSKLLTFFSLTLLFVFTAAAQANCDKKKTNENARQANANTMQNTNKEDKTPQEKSSPNNATGEIETLAEGSYGEMEQPFLFVARDKETYAKLKGLLNDLPPASSIDFDRQAVIAAFAGTKNTGGYAVKIEKTGETVSVSVSEPPPGAIVTEALTMPYKVAAVPVEAGSSLNLKASENWKQTAEIFEVSSGEFESSGGIAGNLKRFSARGTVGVYRFNDLVTLSFDLKGTGADGSLKLNETASGSLSGEKIELLRIEAENFSEGPKPPVKISGTLAGGKLQLNFEPLPSKMADGFQLRGSIEAVRKK